MTCSFAVVLILAALQTTTESRGILDQWRQYKHDFNKTYFRRSEEKFRFSLWLHNTRAIDRHNLEADFGYHSFWKKINQFSDMTEDEFQSTSHGLDTDIIPNDEMVTTSEMKTQTHNETLGLPNEVDWRKQGYVTAVKNQGACACCYAFAATGALEGQHFKKTKKLVSLSEQNILDCTNNDFYGNNGCKSGQMDISYDYVIENGGIDTEKSYPYIGKAGTCRYKNITKVVGSRARMFVDLPKGNEAKLQEAVAKHGPVSVGISNYGTALRDYSQGVFDNKACNGTLNHAVLVVGYGVENGREYWLVKNSWGTKWGLKGYVKMSRNKNNQCGIASLASYPIV